MFDFSDQVRSRIGVVLLDGFSMLTLGSILEPLTLFHRRYAECASVVLLLGETGTHAISNGGFAVSCEATVEELAEYISGTACLDVLFVCGPSDRVEPFKASLVADLRRAHRMGVQIVGLGNIGWLLASMGLLDHAKATVHWNTLAAFSEKNVLVDAEDAIFTSARTVATSGGESATLDLVLELLAKDSPEVAREVADQLLVSVRRDGDTPQPSGELAHSRNLPVSLVNAITLMSEALEEPTPTHELALQCQVSTRQLERLFRAYLDMSPMQYYTRIRLEKVHQLVTFTSIPFIEVALAAGFSSTSLMSKKFRQRYGTSPSELRRKLDYAVNTPRPLSVKRHCNV